MFYQTIFDLDFLIHLLRFIYILFVRLSIPSTNPTTQHILQTLINHKISKQMERRQWTPHQDQVLKNLYQKVKLNKWSLIARCMEEQYSFPPRTGKQCRQRYNNHLNPSFAKEDWTEYEEMDLLRLHNELGNKWAIIAARLEGRTDNGVKNHFFAKLRKSMRRINKIIQERFKKKLKQLKLNVLYKIVEASEQKFKKTPLCSEQTSKNSCVLKNKILAFSLNTPQEIADDDFAELIHQINQFSKNYKRKPKQLRRVPDQNKSLDFASYGQNNQDSNEQKSIFEKEDSQDEIIRPDQKFESLLEQSKSEQPEIKMNLRSKSFKAISSEADIKPQTEAQMVLNRFMIQEDQNSLMPPLPPMLVKRGTSSEFIVDSSRNEHEFCTSVDNIVEQSGVHNKLPSPLAFTRLMKKQSCDEQLFRLCRD